MGIPTIENPHIFHFNFAKMTLKQLRDLGYQIEKKSIRLFTISGNGINASIEKITDTKFKYENNEATAHHSILLEQIKQNSHESI